MIATKEQERKALEQIKKIVNGLGENSYVATAFEGCFDIAKDNIDNDFSCSMEQRWEDELKRVYCLEKELKLANEKVKELEQVISVKRDQISSLVEKNAEGLRKLEEAEERILDERKEVRIETVDGDRRLLQFIRIQYFNNNGFRFVNVIEKSGWTTSYKIDDLKVFEIL